MPASLCFHEVFEAKEKGEITEEEYIHQLFQHCTGAEHERNERGRRDWELLQMDRFGHSVRSWSLEMDPVEDATPFEKVFAAYRTGNVDEVKVSLSQLSAEHASYVRKSLAMLALQGRRAAVLRLCLEQGGFAFENYFEEAANKFQAASDDPETFKVLEESRFRTLHPYRMPRAERDSDDDDDDEWEEGEEEEDEDPAAVFDVGGRLPVDW